MNPFKIGSRVMCVRASRFLKGGDVHVVEAIKEELGSPFVRLVGG